MHKTSFQLSTFHNGKEFSLGVRFCLNLKNVKRIQNFWLRYLRRIKNARKFSEVMIYDGYMIVCNTNCRFPVFGSLFKKYIGEHQISIIS